MSALSSPHTLPKQSRFFTVNPSEVNHRLFFFHHGAEVHAQQTFQVAYLYFYLSTECVYLYQTASHES